MQKLKQYDDHFLEKMAKHNRHAQGVSDISSVNRLGKIIKSIGLYHYAKINTVRWLFLEKMAKTTFSPFNNIFTGMPKACQIFPAQTAHAKS